MSDEMIRELLVERRKQARQQQRREQLVELVQDTVAWVSLFGIVFMLAVVG